MTRLVLGVGSEARGDDRAGVEAVRRLQPPGVVVAEPFDLIDLWGVTEEVVVVDAARSGSSPGTIHRIEVGCQELPRGVLATSTHALGVTEIVELARALDRLPERLLIYGIEAGDVAVGEGLSPEVESAVETVVEELEHA